jgi:hypothetical protein
MILFITTAVKTSKPTYRSNPKEGHTIAQVVSHLLPTVAAQVRSQVRSCGICGGLALGQVFSEYFGFPCQSSFQQMLHTHLSSGAGTTDQLVAAVPSGLNLTPPQEIEKHPKELHGCMRNCASGNKLLNNSEPSTFLLLHFKIIHMKITENYCTQGCMAYVKMARKLVEMNTAIMQM